MATPIKSLFPPIEKKPFLLNKQQKSGSRRSTSCIDTCHQIYQFYQWKYLSVFILTVHQWLFYQHVWQKMSVEKIFIGNFWSVGEFVINKFIDSFTNKPCVPKKITSFILLVILLIRFSISSTWGPYVIPSVKLHITNRMSSVVSLMS